MSFRFSRTAIETASLHERISDPACGGYAAFEGWVRNHNEGRQVRHLEYEAFEDLAVKEGERILAEAVERFGIEHAACVHRIGALAIGDMAVWVGVSARHRHEAFVACRYIIDEVKHRVPIWKKEHYVDGDSGWVNCERCAAPSPAAQDPAHDHNHSLGDHTHSHPARAHSGEHRPATEPELPATPSTTHPRDTRGGAGGSQALVPDYSRQMTLKEVGTEGQAKLRASSVLVVGAGGLGVPVLTYLAGAGIGRIGIVDGDNLEPSNLHRQTLYALADAGQPKAQLAASRLRALNPHVDVQIHATRLDADNGAAIVKPYDLVIDCTDNFSTKFLLNDLCMSLDKPVVLSSVYQYEGQLQVVRPDRDSACLRCVWPEATRDGLVGNCAEAGVLGPVPGVFGSLQALEALKILLDLPGQLGNELLMFDLTSLAISRVRARRAGNCATEHRARALQRQDARPLEVEFVSLDAALERGFEIIDVREARELAEVPTPAERSLHIPLAVLLRGASPLARAQKHLLICASGQRSLAAAQELQAQGYANVYSLRGGIAALRALPVPSHAQRTYSS